MKHLKNRSYLIFAVLALLFVVVISSTGKKEDIKVNKNEKGTYKAIAYVTVPASENWRWIGTDGKDEDDAVSKVDTNYITHINFAFGMLEAYQYEEGKSGCPLKEGKVVSKEAYKNPKDGKYHYKATLQGWIEEMDALVDGREYLRALVDLKKQKPELNVLLSIGGWDSDGFCYMARTKEGRQEFINSCIQIVNDYSLDGIDIDWEFPTNGGWGEIANCKDCIADARILIKEFRTAFDKEFEKDHKILSIASGASQPWVDTETLESLDYINVMCYDQNPGTGTVQAGMDFIIYGMDENISMAGDTEENRKKFNLGVPFYNEGGPYLVPYYKGWKGVVDASPELIQKKMEWVIENGYGGGFYWAYSMDVFEQDVKDSNDGEIKILQKTLYNTLNKHE